MSNILTSTRIFRKLLMSLQEYLETYAKFFQSFKDLDYIQNLLKVKTV